MTKSIDHLPELSAEQANRYSRHILIPTMDWTGQERLLASHAVVVGLGGLGCSVAQFLAASGVGSLTLIDDDEVELSNLQRQVLHSETTLGLSKVQSAKQSLLQLNSSLSITTLEKRLTQAEMLAIAQQADVLIDCTDNLDSRNNLNQVSVNSRTPLFTGAAIRLEGQVSCFFPKGSRVKFDKVAHLAQPELESDQPCYACLSHLYGEQSQSCMESGVLAPVVGVIGAMQALETVKYLSGVGRVPKGKLMLFDAATSEWRQMIIPVNPSCSVCQAAGA